MIAKTLGDRYEIECPHCCRFNKYVSKLVSVIFGEIVQFAGPCENCGKIVYYQAKEERHEIVVFAYSENPFEKIA